MKDNIRIAPDNITEVLLVDGWHEVVGGITLAPCTAIGINVLGYEFKDETGATLAGPASAVQALKTSS